MEVKTNSSSGSLDWVYLRFYTPQNEWTGGFHIRFLSTPLYYIMFCSSWTRFPTTLPSATEKIWRITLDKSDGIRLKVHCNEELVLDVLLSDQVCDHIYYRFFWRDYWSRDVEKIKFHTGDRASDYYRPYSNILRGN